MKKNEKNQLDLPQLLGEPSEPFEKFQDDLKISYWDKNIPKEKDWPREWTTIYFKEYPRLDKIILPNPILPKKNLGEVLQSRKSERVFSKNPITIESLSNLLYSSAGIKNKNDMRRFYPSPGGRYGLEIYIFSINSDLPIGIYHYNPKVHSLEVLLKTPKKELLSCFNQKWLENSGIIVLFTGVFWRSTMKYGQRGYRLTLEEAGHIGQNLYLVSEAFDINCCGIGAWLDPKIEELLDIDGVKESTVYAIAIGNKP